MDPYYIHIQKENKSENLSWQLSKDLCCCVGCQADPKKDKSCWSRARAKNKFPITKVGQEGVMKKNSYFVIYKSFENLSLNNFQVIDFERMSKNCLKVNIL